MTLPEYSAKVHCPSALVNSYQWPSLGPKDWDSYWHHH
jgi:hypothetical protein